MWIQVGRVRARMVKELKFNFLQNLSDILALSFWWNKTIHPQEMGFFKNKTTQLHSLGWVTIEDVWVVANGRFASIEKMGDKFVLFLEEEFTYGKIVAKLKEMWGNQLKS